MRKCLVEVPDLLLNLFLEKVIKKLYWKLIKTGNCWKVKNG